MSTTLSLRINEELKEQIEKLSQISNRKKSDILLGWIKEKLDLERWQIEETNKAIVEADAGSFASNKEVMEYFNRWSK